MSLEKICTSCASNTYYSCVNCDSGICNRPSCSRVVDVTHPAYSEEHPKKISKCITCIKNTVPQEKKQKLQNQPTIKAFFDKK